MEKISTILKQTTHVLSLSLACTIDCCDDETGVSVSGDLDGGVFTFDDDIVYNSGHLNKNKNQTDQRFDRDFITKILCAMH